MKRYQPLAGVRVASFEIAFALPAGTRALHDLGAEVVRITPPERQVDRYIGVIDGVFHGKPCVSIDLTTTKGRSVAFDLALAADVVCNNFRPSVLPKYGLGAEQLRARKPELITLQLSGYGAPGPWSNFPAFGPSTEAAGGLNRLLVNTNETPIRVSSGVFSDQLAGRHAALAIVAALRKRQQTGRGAALDLSMTSAIMHLLGPQMVEASLAADRSQADSADSAIDETTAPPTNRDLRYVPQGVYPCAGEDEWEDEWIAISVTNNAQWRTLVGLMATDRAPAFESPHATRAERWRVHDQIDTWLSGWSRQHDKQELANRLQAAGIAAAPVGTVRDAAADPQFAARNALQWVRHRRAKLGYLAHPHPPLPWRIVGQSRRRVTDYHDSGADNVRILSQWLKLDAATVRALERDGTLHRAPPLQLTPRPDGPRRDPDHARKLGLPADSSNPTRSNP